MQQLRPKVYEDPEGVADVIEQARARLQKLRQARVDFTPVFAASAVLALLAIAWLYLNKRKPGETRKSLNRRRARKKSRHANSSHGPQETS